MTTESVHALFVDDSGVVSLTQLTELSGLSEAELRELVDCGALAPADAAAPRWEFSTHCIVVARTARRLREDFALEDVHSLAIALRLLQRIAELEQQLAALRART